MTPTPASILRPAPPRVAQPGAASRRRAFTLLETLLAVSITAMIGVAMSSMMMAVTQSVTTRTDTRTMMVRSSAGQARLAAYVSPSRCVLDCSTAKLVLWFGDTRESGTVHASEVRWLIFDADAGELVVHFLSFPAIWSETKIALTDTEYAADADWDAVLADFASRDLTASLAILDGLGSLAYRTDDEDPLAARVVAVDLTFFDIEDDLTMSISDCIREHEAPDE